MTRGVDDKTRVKESSLPYALIAWAVLSVKDGERLAGSSSNLLHFDVKQEFYAFSAELVFKVATHRRTNGNAGFVEIIRCRHPLNSLRFNVDFLTLYCLEANMFERAGRRSLKNSLQHLARHERKWSLCGV